MQEDNNAIERSVLVELMRFNGCDFGARFRAGGWVWHFYFHYHLIKGGEQVGPHLALLGQYLSAIKSPLEEASSVFCMVCCSASLLAT